MLCVLATASCTVVGVPFVPRPPIISPVVFRLFLVSDVKPGIRCSNVLCGWGGVPFMARRIWVVIFLKSDDDGRAQSYSFYDLLKICHICR